MCKKSLHLYSFSPGAVQRTGEEWWLNPKKPGRFKDICSWHLLSSSWPMVRRVLRPDSRAADETENDLCIKQGLFKIARMCEQC